MKSATSYYLILAVYILLWTCQSFTSHLTHSLMILTDSYINLFKILDILLGIVHLRTQIQLNQQRQQTLLSDSCEQSKHEIDIKTPSMAGSLFDCICTYQFKRLPLLGTFINGLFLMALLMSAAIEGIQTCIHVGHSEFDSQATILTQNPFTYPIILLGFAFVGLIMQYCSLKAHEMREEELCSESLIDIRREQVLTSGANSQPLELNAGRLQSSHGDKRDSLILSASLQSLSKNRKKYDLTAMEQASSMVKSTGEKKRITSELADSIDGHNNIQRISMKSLDDYGLEHKSGEQDKFDDIEASKISPRQYHSNHDACFWFRCLSSPVAMTTCALIILFIDSPWFTEISDATLAVLVVILLFVASFKPMKMAGRVLLQTTPDGVDLNQLKRKLLSQSRHIIEVKDLHVWSLTARTNRIATCVLVLDAAEIKRQSQVQHLLDEARFVFQEQNIKCTTIEPLLRVAITADEPDGENVTDNLKD